MASPQTPPYAPGPKKTNPVVIILLVVAGLFVLAGIAVVGAGFFIAHKVHQAAANPGLAAAKLIVAANPDLETVSSDDDRGTITVRDRKTGKESTVNFEDVKSGKITFTGDDNKTVSIETSGGQNGGLTFKSSDGKSLRIGAGGKIPSWVPAFPGSSPDATFSGNADGDEGGMAVFTVKDTLDKVAGFYYDSFTDAGLKATKTTVDQKDTGSAIIVTGQDNANKESIVATLGQSSPGNVTVHLTFSKKK
jgi:hypothetical protein